MQALGMVAAPVTRAGVAMVFCPHCFIECTVPAGRSLDGVACVRCLLPLTPEPALAPEHARALREAADWWDRGLVPGPGYAVVVCPRCEAACVVPVGRPVARIGCAACLRPLGEGPLLRHDLVPGLRRTVLGRARGRPLAPAA